MTTRADESTGKAQPSAVCHQPPELFPVIHPKEKGSMRNGLRAATLESKFPLLAVENGCIVSKDADVTASFAA
jgi:hypothetical protein